MTSKRILLIGGGGHCESVLDALLSAEDYAEIGIIERERSENASLLGIPVIGADDDVESLFQSGWTDAFITLGSVGNSSHRQRLYTSLKQIGFHFPVIVDSSAVIGRNVEIGEGTFVGKRAVLNAGTTVGACAIINTGAILEHDCLAGQFAHISTGALLCGNVTVGSGTHIGAGSVVRHQIHIGNDTLIGAGSVVVKDIPDQCTAYGNPCRVVSLK